LEQALVAYQEVADRRGETGALCGLGKVALSQGHYDDALSHYEQALHLAQEIGYRIGQSIALCGLGDVAVVQNRHDEAATQYQLALPIYREMGDREGEALALVGYGRTLAWVDSPAASSVVEEAVRIFDAIGLPDQAAAARRHLAALHQPAPTAEGSTDVD
jgi:tetratricopeptide (TPR) repeat protein